jgi:uncharacterized protein YdaU (DUF1376 family)
MPWYPLYHEAFELDTQTWTCAQIGALIRLMNHQWANGFVPDDPGKLARICRVDPSEWPEIWEPLEAKFKRRNSGKLINRRLAIEQKRIKRRSEAGKKAAGIRWGNRSKINQPDATAHADGIVSTSTATSIKNKEREASPPLPDGLDRKAWDTWLAYRRESRMKKWVPRTIKTRTKMLAQYTHAEQQAIIDHSISNGYQGLFPQGALGGGNGRRVLPSPTEQVEEATGVKRL